MHDPQYYENIVFFKNVSIRKRLFTDINFYGTEDVLRNSHLLPSFWLADILR